MKIPSHACRISDTVPEDVGNQSQAIADKFRSFFGG